MVSTVIPREISPVAVDLDAEREASLGRHQEEIAPAMLTMRAEQVMRAAAPALTAEAFAAAADKLYSRMDEVSRAWIAARAVELATAGVRHRQSDPIRADRDPARRRPRRVRKVKAVAQASSPTAQEEPASEPEPPKGEDVVIAPLANAPTKPARHVPAIDRYRDRVREVIAPLLEQEPALTPGEALQAAHDAGVDVTYAVFQRLWREYLREHGLGTREVARVRASRAAVLRLERERAGEPPLAKRLKPKRKKRVPAKVETPKVEVEEPAMEPVRISNGDGPRALTPLPVPAPKLEPGISLIPGLDGCRLVVDITVPADGAWLMMAVVASAIDAAMSGEGAS